VQELRAGDPRRVGPYELLGRLGVGGMGKVYLATGDRGLLAVKVVHPGLAHDDTFRARFRHEIDSGRKVREPWALAVVDSDPDAPSPWLATAYVPGPSLDAAVAATGPLPEPTVHVLAVALAEALAHIHETRLVHRDVKPSNVLLGPDRPYLIDLGIARAAEGTQLTATGAIMGTPAFMSPEQTEGAETSAATDVFSLGAVLVFAATGRGPFGDGPPLAVMRRISDDPPDLGETAEPVRSLAAACLEKRPAARPTAAELGGLIGEAPTPTSAWLPERVTALAPVVTDSGHPDLGTRVGGTALMRTDPEPGPARPAIGRRALLIGAAVTGVAAVAGVTAAVAGSGRTPAPPQLPPAPAPATTPPRPEPAQRWEADAGPGSPVAVVVDGDVVHVGGRDSLFAFDRGTGARRWAFETAPGSGYTPTESQITAGDGAVYVVGQDAVHALDAVTGAARWAVPIGDNGILGTSIGAAAGVLYVANAERLEKRDAASGHVLWTFRSEFAGSPTPDGARLIIQDGSAVTALAADTGKAIWRHDTGHHLDMRLAVADGVVCCFNAFEGELIALDEPTGTRRWSTTVPELGTGEGADGPPAVGAGAVYVAGGDEQVHAFAADSGAPRWNLPDRDIGGGTVSTQPVHVDGVVYAGSQNGRVYAWDATSGAERWVKAPFGGGVVAIAVSGGAIYTGLSGGRVVALGQP
jgi:eukaryotic-like serine/threonine-protein kinase